MKKLLRAFQIFAKYIPDDPWPITCEHDVLYVHCPCDEVSEEDREALAQCGFEESDNGGFEKWI